MRNILMNSHVKGHLKGITSVNKYVSSGACQPPKNITAVSVEINSMFMYSAMKNSAKVMPEYSTMWPATISDSPSTTSKGARLVSATPDTKYTTNMGSKGSQFHDRKFSPIEDRKSTRLNSSHSS